MACFHHRRHGPSDIQERDHSRGPEAVGVCQRSGCSHLWQRDAVIFGSGMKTDEIAEDPAMLARMNVDPARQLLVGQCSGALRRFDLVSRASSSLVTKGASLKSGELQMPVGSLLKRPPQFDQLGFVEG